MEFKAQRPFHPVRLHAQLQRSWPGVYCTQGALGLASKPADAGLIDVAGANKTTRHYGKWWASVLPAQSPNSLAFQQRMKDWHPDFADRVQEVLLAGRAEH